MRIFIKNYSLTELTNKVSSLKQYLIDTKTKLEITTNDGEYYVDASKVYKINVSDKDTILYENYYNNKLQYLFIIFNELNLLNADNHINHNYLCVYNSKCSDFNRYNIV